jgi:integrase
MSRTKKSTKLPVGVSADANRPGLYRLSVMISGKRYSEYCRPPGDNLTQKQLQSALQKAIDQFREKAERGSLRGQVTDKSTLEQAAEWYFSTAKIKLRASTIEEYSGIFNFYIAPTLGDVKVRDITVPMVNQLIADLLDHGGGTPRLYPKPVFAEKLNTLNAKKDSKQLNVSPTTLYRTRKAGKSTSRDTAQKLAAYYGLEVGQAFEYKREPSPLSPVTVNRIAVTISAIFTSLVKAEVLIKNPVTNATKPETGEMKRGAYIDSSQLPLFINALETLNGDCRIALTLMLQLGLRNSEARGLRWADLDFQKNEISVNNAIGQTANGEVIGQPKTKRSVRKLPLSPYLRGVLLEHQDEQAAYALSIGSAWTDNGLVVTNRSGGILSHSQTYKAVKSIVKNNPQLPQDLHPHSLRHSFVSLLISSGVDIVTVAKLAGDTVDIITRIYAHSLQERETAAMAQIGGVFAISTAQPKLQLVAVNE